MLVRSRFGKADQALIKATDEALSGSRVRRDANLPARDQAAQLLHLRHDALAQAGSRQGQLRRQDCADDRNHAAAASGNSNHPQQPPNSKSTSLGPGVYCVNNVQFNAEPRTTSTSQPGGATSRRRNLTRSVDGEQAGPLQENLLSVHPVTT
jgi:hypothetical protein